MIALSDCAKRNADRELARVLDLLGSHIRAHQQSIDVAALPEVITRFAAGKRSLEALRDELERLAHRTP
jgi:hypothetical protein